MLGLRLIYNHLQTCLVIVIFVSIFSCTDETKRERGICLSFDDRTIEDWYRMRDLLKEYNASVTFFITQFDSLNSLEVDMLRELENDGHEIGSHGALHVISENYISTYSYNQYLKNEIEANSASMRSQGFVPKSFAYPYGAKYWFTDILLLDKFEVLRGVANLNDEHDITSIDEIFYDFDDDRTLNAISIDQNSRLTKGMIQKAMKRASDNKEVLLLYGHCPINNNDKSAYNFDIEFLKFILSEARSNNLKHFKMSEL